MHEKTSENKQKTGILQENRRIIWIE